MRQTALLLVPLPHRLRALLLLAVMISPPLLAATDAHEYSLDPVHTRVMFTVGHAGFSQAIGTVSGSTGTLHFDPDDWPQARLDVRVPLGRVDLGDEKWNQATLAGNLLDAADFPEATFVSTRIEPIGPGRASVHGMLTLRGVSREIVLEVTLNALKRHPLPPFRRTAGFSATTTIKRSDFGITAWRSVIGDEVQLRIEAEATRSRGDNGNGKHEEDPGHEVREPTDELPANETET